jgi:4-oxalocrotonate tautomerase
MPLVRIDLAEGTPAGYRAAIGDVVYRAMTGVLNVPEDDKFMVISEHAPGDLIVDPDYLGIHRTADAVVIQVILNEGRTVAVKQDFYRAVADGLHERIGLRREDVFISLVEVKKENWSFGNGEAQYA